MDSKLVRPEGINDNREGDYEHTDWTAPFNFQRRREQIAKITRRGVGNVLVACKQGLIDINMTTERGISSLTHSKTRTVVFETGEVTPEPFAVLGYKGHQPDKDVPKFISYNEHTMPGQVHQTDAGMIFLHDEQGHGVLVPHLTNIYWTKIW